LAEAVALAFAPSGPIAAADARYTQRRVQQEFALAVAQAIEEREALVVEAGTGVGKTFAYLVPLLLSGQRALVSTATKSLQDQLFLRDLPRLVDALHVPVRVALLKGRTSYLCLHRLEQARAGAELPDRPAVRALARVEAWAPSTRTGDLAEIDGLDERSPVIALVTSTRDNCLAGECPRLAQCHVVRARREAMAADLVVVNHHLFFADVALRDTGIAELLPSVDAVVFDEAHQLCDTGVQFLGLTLGSAQTIDFARDLKAIGLAQARGAADWQALAGAIEQAGRQLRLAAAGSLREVRAALKLRWRERSGQAAFDAALAALAGAADGAREALGAVIDVGPDVARLGERAASLAQAAERFAGAADADRVRWIDLTPHAVRLIESPLDIRQLIGEQRSKAPKTWIFTSATLGDDAPLSWFTRAAALEDARALCLGSPFDYARQARLYVPPEFPRPNESAHAPAIAALAARCAAALRGRTFVLTTTLRALPLIAQALRDGLEAAGAADVEVLVQGSGAKRVLLQRFLAARAAVLVGSQTFWEGIDVPGDALQCVIIDKLPFPPPNDPVIEARVNQLERSGRDPFVDCFVAEAAIALKQGAGRLVRSETDRGLLVVGDPRLARMSYGRRLIAALPPMTRVQSEEEALDWLRELAADHSR
jgi:ATP-dependent DNA helicase DinG